MGVSLMTTDNEKGPWMPRLEDNVTGREPWMPRLEDDITGKGLTHPIFFNEDGVAIDDKGRTLDPQLPPLALLNEIQREGLSKLAREHGGITISEEPVAAGTGKPTVDSAGNTINYPAVMVPGIVISDDKGNLVGSIAIDKGSAIDSISKLIYALAAGRETMEIQTSPPEQPTMTKIPDTGYKPL